MNDILTINYVSELSVIADGSTSLNISNLLDNVEYEERDKILHMSISKVKYGGTIYITGIDIFVFCKSCLYNNMSMEQANSIMSTRSFDSVIYICSQLKSMGIRVTSKQLDHNGNFAIEGIRDDTN